MTVATFVELAKLSTDEIILLHRNNLPGSVLPKQKSLACQDLAVHALAKSLSLADLRCASPVPAAPALPSHKDLIQMIDGQVQHLAPRQDFDALKLSVGSSLSAFSADLRAMRDVTNQTGKALPVIQADICTLADEIGRLDKALTAQPKVAIDQVAIDQAIAAQVDAAFGAFKSAVVAAGVESQGKVITAGAGRQAGRCPFSS